MKTQEDDYREAGFAGHLDWGSRPAVLVVDAVTAYTDPRCPLNAGPPALAAAVVMGDVLSAARAAGVPVYITFMDVDETGANAGLFFQKVTALKAFQPGSPFAVFVPGVEPQPTDVVLAKQYPSAFFGTGLADRLAADGIDTVFIVGYSTSGCIRATALDAMQNGFVPVVVTDGVADRDPRIHAANLFDIAHKMSELAESQDVIARVFNSAR